MGKWFNLFHQNFKKMIVNIEDNSKKLDDTSKQLSQLSGLMNEKVGDSSSSSHAVASASEEMGVNLNAISKAMEEGTENVNSVTASPEEVSLTVKEIANNSNNAQQTTQKAVKNVETAKVQVDELGTNAKEIGKITEVITEISEQTNLLALNATIEAACAGEAGKGFTGVTGSYESFLLN